MAEQKTGQDANSNDARIRELTEENELLFDQLHVVQEELEKYYHRLRDCEQRTGGTGAANPVVVVAPQADEALAENLKLRALVEQQKAALRVKGVNSRAERLGAMVIRSFSSIGSFLSLPVRLRGVWKTLTLKTPPEQLGGETFQKVLDAHAFGGGEAVERLLDSVAIPPAIRASAYTALARRLQPTDARGAADFARLAWETDPQTYRLKWLAFRVDDAGDVVNAEVLLDMLPEDVGMSDSERRRAERIRQGSQGERSRQARKVTDASRTETTKLCAAMADLRTACEEKGRELAQRDKRIAELQKTSAEDSARCKAEAAARLKQHDEAHRQELEQREKQIAELRKAVDQAKREAAQANEARAALQRRMEAQKQESDALALRTGQMLKNMLTQFEADTPLLSRLMRIVMGSTADR